MIDNNELVYYLMLETIQGNGSMFWEWEIYTKEEFKEGGLNLEDVLKERKCKLWEPDDDDV